jgi:hypothetical protein
MPGKENYLNPFASNYSPPPPHTHTDKILSLESLTPYLKIIYPNIGKFGLFKDFCYQP